MNINFSGGLSRLALLAVRLYQLTFSSYMGVRRCKYHPTCSCYMSQSIRHFGFFRGGFLGLWRLLRCNPWSRGGYDPLPQELPSVHLPFLPFLFKSAEKRAKNQHTSNTER